MYKGKKKCNTLKALRRRIADENGIPLNQPECTHQGDCRGTCPRCEAEMHYLEQALSQRLSLGKMATVAGLTLTLAACNGSGDNATLTTEKPLEATDTLPVNLPGGDTSSSSDMPLDPDTVAVPGLLEIIDKTGNNTLPLQATDRKEDDTELIEGEMPDEDLLGIVLEESASFPGGEEALYKYLDEHIQYPAEAKREGISGRVYISFTVDTDGTVCDAVIRRDIGGGCGQEVLRVVQGMPKWIPGKQSGKKVRSSYALPISFSLEEEQ